MNYTTNTIKTMFYCSRNTKIRGIEGKAYVIRPTNYEPGRWTFLLRASFCEKSRPTYTPWWIRENHFGPYYGDNIYSECFVASDRDFEIWDDEEGRWLTISELREKKYIKSNDLYISIGREEDAPRSDWNEVYGEFEMEAAPNSSEPLCGYIRLRAKEPSEAEEANRPPFYNKPYLPRTCKDELFYSCGCSDEEFLEYLYGIIPQYKGKPLAFFEKFYCRTADKLIEYREKTFTQFWKDVLEGNKEAPYNYYVISYDHYMHYIGLQTLLESLKKHGYVFSPVVRITHESGATDVIVINEGRELGFFVNAEQVFKEQQDHQNPYFSGKAISLSLHPRNKAGTEAAKNLNIKESKKH